MHNCSNLMYVRLEAIPLCLSVGRVFGRSPEIVGINVPREGPSQVFQWIRSQSSFACHCHQACGWSKPQPAIDDRAMQAVQKGWVFGLTETSTG